MPSNIRTNRIIQARRVKQYKDIDLNFIPNPLTGDLTILSDIDSIKTSLKNIILTRYGEKPYNYLFGSKVTGLLFENFDTLTLILMEKEIRSVVEALEPRVFFLGEGVSVIPDQDENKLRVSLNFGITNIPDRQVDFSFFLERVR
jgi:phage baseplate assembly protein W